MGDHPDRPPGLLTRMDYQELLGQQPPAKGVRRRGLARPQSTTDQQHRSAGDEQAPQTGCYVGTLRTRPPAPASLLLLPLLSSLRVSGGCGVPAGVVRATVCPCVPVQGWLRGGAGNKAAKGSAAAGGGKAGDQLTAGSVITSPEAP